VQGFIDATGATHPVLRMGSVLRPLYQMSVDNYAVIDADGFVRYLSTAEGFGSLNDTAVRTALDDWLVTTSIEAATWSAVRALYRDPLGAAPAVPVRGQ